MAVPNIKIVMTGPTGTGKTSLLAAMYPHLETQFPSGDYELVPDENTRAALDALRSKLSQLGEGGIVVHDKRITGTPNADEFKFALQYENENGKKDTELSLKIFDIPGAYCTEDDGAEAKEVLRNSDISFWCIDSVALMEPKSPKGQWIGEDNLSVNKPETMVNLLARSNINDSHTVVIVLMRAESYRNNGYADLYEQLKTKIARYVLELRKNRKIDKVYFCAVETTGNLKYQGGNAEKGYEFIRETNMTYKPENCEIPVLCAVKSALEKTVEQARQRYYRLAQLLPFLRFWLAAKPKSVAKRLAKRLKKSKAKLQIHLQSKLFEW
jgi:GTPase SAR1 family protein